MIRVIYRWRVLAGMEEEFAAAWSIVTAELRERVKGARGSVLMRSRSVPGELIAVARWESVEAYQAYRDSLHAGVMSAERVAASKRMKAAVAASPTFEVLDELEDQIL